MRNGKVCRETKETTISVQINLDGTGKAEISSSIGFFDHMLTHVARHGLFDLVVKAEGDLEVDGHHTVEDVGICLGKAFDEAIGDPVGLVRYGHAVIPMDEALAETAIDISGRPFLLFDVSLPRVTVGSFDAELVEEFFRAFSVHSQTGLHIILRHGNNVHHCIEAIFKAFGRALDMATQKDPRVKDIPSTKGML